MSKSVGSWMSCCQRGEELLFGVITGYDRCCQVEVKFDGARVVDCSVEGVGGAFVGESGGSDTSIGDD